MEEATWVLAVGTIVLAVTTVVLAIITWRYVRLTGSILDETREQTKLIPNPVLGIHFHQFILEAGPDPSMRKLVIDFDLSNKGNAPAIDVTVDAEVVLHYTYRNGQQELPAHSQPAYIAFVGTKKEDFVAILGSEQRPTFGSVTLNHLRREFLDRQIDRLVYRLYDLTDEDIRIVEESTK